MSLQQSEMNSLGHGPVNYFARSTTVSKSANRHHGWRRPTIEYLATLNMPHSGRSILANNALCHCNNQIAMVRARL